MFIIKLNNNGDTKEIKHPFANEASALEFARLYIPREVGFHIVCISEPKPTVEADVIDLAAYRAKRNKAVC